MEKLAATAAEQQQMEPISAHVDKLTTQLDDNKAIIDDLDRNVASIAALKAAANSLKQDAGLDDENAQGALYILVITQCCHKTSFVNMRCFQKHNLSTSW